MRQKKGLVLVIMFRFISTSESTESQVIESGVKNESKQMAKTRKLAGIVNYYNGPLYLFFFFFHTDQHFYQ